MDPLLFDYGEIAVKIYNTKEVAIFKHKYVGPYCLLHLAWNFIGSNLSLFVFAEAPYLFSIVS